MPADDRTTWRLRGGTLDLADGRTRVMGILNVTPDSFYDGGRHAAHEAAVEHGRRLLEEGADLVDAGGESTRPGAKPVPADEELDRVLPVVEALIDEVEAAGAYLSVDTRKAAVADACLDAGAHAINDVTALRDPDMAGVVADAGAGLVLMHMQGTPETMQDDPRYEDVVGDVAAVLEDRRDHALDAGLPAGAICLDPGIGFGKTAAHNVEILARLPEFAALSHPLLVGPSRKSFLGAVAGHDDPDRRLPATLGAVVVCALRGVDVVRVHDVAEARDALAVADAVRRAAGPHAPTR